MEVRFLGGAGEVGRSAILVHDKKRMLFDYGIKVEGPTEYPMAAGKIDACFVSHAHLDHSGFVPSIYKDGSPETFATVPTMKLAELLIEDSIKLHKKRHEHERIHRSQLKTLMSRYLPCEYGSVYEFGEYQVSMHDAGHICGSSITLVERYQDDRRLVYTGDFKIEPQLLEGNAEIVKNDVLIMESTYAGSDHPDREELTKKFIDDVREIVDNDGTALIPVFAVGRSQEILAMMEKYGLIDRTYIDGMARTATEIVEKHLDFVKNAHLLDNAIRKAQWVESFRSRDSALEGGKVILTTSGMLNGGPVLNYITRLNRHSKIFLTGYQVEGTNGRKLMENSPLDIDGRRYSVKVPHAVYDFSAHAGKTDLHKYVRESNPETVICVHGSEENSKLLAEELKLDGFNAIAPKVGDSIKIDF